ncbi:MAG: YihY/virulence factor BrkB family protein [Alphaproteobacteria bacterium]
MPSWIGAAVDAVSQANRKQLSLVAAGVAFYMLLSIFPGAAVFVAVYGIVADPATIGTLLDDLAPFAPPEALALVRQVVDQTLQDNAQLQLTAVVSFLIALWSAGSAVRALMAALQLGFPNAHAYGFLVFLVLSLVFTIVGIVLVALVISVLVLVPIVFEALRAIDTGDHLQFGWDLLRMLEPLILVGLSLAILTPVYWIGSGRKCPALRCAALSAVATTALWLGASRVLSIYVARFANFEAVYGPLGAVAGLMLWFWISAFLLLLGFEFTAALARRRAAPGETSRAAAPAFRTGAEDG